MPDNRVGRAYHQNYKLNKKVKKRCLRCKKTYKGFTSLSIKLSNKPEPGLCPQCQKYADLDVYLPEDWHNQDIQLDLD